MRALHSDLTAAQQSGTLKPAIKITLTHGEDTFVLELDRLKKLNHLEEPYRANAKEVELDNSDGYFTDKDLKGYKAVISYGLVTASGTKYSDTAPLWVIWQQLFSAQGKLTCQLTMLGIPDLMDEDDASDSYIPTEADTKTVKTLLTEIITATLACYSHCQAYEVVFDSEDSLIDSYRPKDGFRIYTGGSRLAAIKRLVFEEKELSLYELAKLLDSDWEGQESLHARIVNQFPHFGNDQDDIDGIAARIIEEFSAILKERRPFRGGDYVLGTTAGGENMHIEFGRVTGATPDGRADGDPLADSLGASQGRDRQGVTALLNSVAKLPHSLLPTATTLNVKLDPKLLAGDAGVSKIAALIRGHFLAGGQQCQFNLVNREMLLEAKRCPEEHSDLMVRVAGYSAPFTSLWEDLQEEIITRTEHAM